MKHELFASDRVAVSIDSQGVAHVTLTRPDKLNALDAAMFSALIEAGQVLSGHRPLRAVVLSGTGRAFCAGLDLTAIGGLLGEGTPPLTERTHGNANLFQRVAMQWRTLPVPVIAAIHGVCLGGGLQIAGGADIRVAAPDARLAVMEMKWGLVPDMGHFALWRGCVREDVLRELTYTNREFSGVEALALGFATIADADPLGRAMALAAEVASRSPHAIRSAKSLFNRAADMPIDEILQAESLEQHQLIGSRNQLEAMRNQKEARPGDFVDP